MNTTPEINGVGAALLEEERLTRPIKIAAGMGLGQEIGSYFERLEEDSIPPNLVVKLYTTAISRIDESARTDYRDDYVSVLSRGLGTFVARVAKDSDDDNFAKDEVGRLLRNPVLRPKSRERIRENLVESGAINDTTAADFGILTFADFEKSLENPAANDTGTDITNESEEVERLSPELQMIVDSVTPKDMAFAYLSHNQAGSEELGNFLNETIINKLETEVKILNARGYYLIRHKAQGDAERLRIDMAFDKAVLRCVDIFAASGNFAECYRVLTENPLKSPGNLFLEPEDDLSERYDRMLNVSMNRYFGFSNE